MSSLSQIGPVMLVGAGKMGLALARGWLDAGLAPGNLILVDPNPGSHARDLAEDYGLTLNDKAVGLQPNILVIAVKPQIMDSVLAGLGAVIGPHTLAVSVAAGIQLDRLGRGLTTGKVVRTMPNTPAQIGKGVTGAVAGPDVTPRERDSISALLSASGSLFWFETETDLDAVTAISGSGPAYVFHLVEAMAQAGEALGLSPTIAMQLARQTVIGSAAMLEADPASAAVLRENVTSPNGTTAAGLSVLMAELPDLMTRTASAARKRAEEMGRQ